MIKRLGRQILERTAPGLLHAWHTYRNTRRFPFEQELTVLDILAPADRVSIDCGAHRGYYSRALAWRCRQVFTFEPNPELYNSLQRVLPRRCILHRYALSDHSGQAFLRIPLSSSGHEETGYAQVIDDPTEHGTSYGHGNVVSIETRRLDEFLDQVKDVGFMKVDVEGHEYPLLRGASGLLDRDKPVLLVEIEKRHDPAWERTIDWLSAREYVPMCLDGNEVSLKVKDLISRQNEDNLMERLSGQLWGKYVNNVIFVPRHLSGTIAKACQGRIGG